MKKLLIISLVFFSCLFNAHAQHKIKEIRFWGLKFGCMKDTAKEHLSSKEGKMVQEVDDMIFFNNLPPFSGYDTDLVVMYFTPSGKLAKGIVTVLPTSRTSVIRNYEALKELFIRKYGKPSSDFYFFSEPYKRGDRDEMEAIKKGKAHICTFWRLRTERGRVNMAISINSDSQIDITYEHVKLNNILVEATRQSQLEEI